MPPLDWVSTLPLGLPDLEEGADSRYSRQAAQPLIRGDEIRCCVRGCGRWLARRRRGPRDDACFCPDHEISMSTSPTYVYKHYSLNFIVGLDLLERVKPLKVESWRLGNERSEDAVSWNVFVALLKLGELRAALRVLTGVDATEEPELYLWGIRIDRSDPMPCQRLRDVRKKLEAGAGIPTEPDVMLRVPGQALVLVEAKFGSPNGTLKGKEDRFGSVQEFLDRYWARDSSADPLAREWIGQQPPDHVLEQLCRNVVFAHWLADTGERAIVVNLVRHDDQGDIEARFAPHLTPNCPVAFRRVAWEHLFQSLPVLGSREAMPLRHYLANKTARLSKAFQFSG